MLALIRKLHFHYPRRCYAVLILITVIFAGWAGFNNQHPTSTPPRPAPYVYPVDPPTTPAPAHCEEDEPCWDPTTMGNHHAGAQPTTTHTARVITVEDHTSNWPTDQALAEWLPATAYTYGTCATSTNCVRIYEVEHLAPTTPGTIKLGIAQWNDPGSARITLSNEAAGRTQMLDTEAHELGHAFGLRHNPRSGLMASNDKPGHQLPSTTEIQEARKNLGVS